MFLQFIKTIGKLKPKIAIAENVAGILRGSAKGHVAEILRELNRIGYETQIFLLNAATMGVPQARERVFFISNNIKAPKLSLAFNEPPIPFSKIKSKTPGRRIKPDSVIEQLWSNKKYGDRNLSEACKRLRGKDSFFNHGLLYDDKVVPTITAQGRKDHTRFDMPNYISDEEIILAQTFPQDFDFCGADVCYVCGMSVPPVMMARISGAVHEQWLSA